MELERQNPLNRCCSTAIRSGQSLLQHTQRRTRLHYCRQLLQVGNMTFVYHTTTIHLNNTRLKWIGSCIQERTLFKSHMSLFKLLRGTFSEHDEPNKGHIFSTQDTTMNMTLLPLLVDVQTAWTLITRCLDAVDLVALYITALEHPEALQNVIYSIRYDVDSINVDSTPEHRRLMLHCAAAHGCLRAVKTLLNDRRSSSGTPLHQHMRQFTPSRVSMRTKRMQWLNTFRPYLYPADVIYTAVHRGDMELVEWLHSCCEYETHVAMKEATLRGHLSLVEWLSNHQATEISRLVRPKDEWIETDVLLPLGPFGAVVWQEFFRRIGDDGRKAASSEHFATPNGHEEYDRWQVYRETSSAFALFSGPLYAAQRGDLPLLRKLHEDTETPWQWSSNVIDVAAKNGHLSVVQWLHEHRTEGCTSVAMDKAALKGHLDVVKYLDSIEVQGTWERTMSAVVACGHLEVAQYLCTTYPRLKPQARSFPGGAFYEDNKSIRGRFDIFRWLHDRDPREYPVTEAHYRYAVKNHCSIEQIDWTRERLENDTLSGISNNWIRHRHLFKHGDLDLVQYLNRLEEVPLGQILNAALRSNHRAIFDHYFQIWQSKTDVEDGGCLLPFQSLIEACRSGWEDLVIDLIERGLVEQTVLTSRSYDSVLLTLDKRLMPLLGLHIDWRAEKLENSRHYHLVLRHLVSARKIAFKDGGTYLAKWAAASGDTVLLRSIVELEIDGFSPKAMFEAVLRDTKAGDIIKIILEKEPQLLDTRVASWASRYAQLRLLDYIFGTLLSEADAIKRQKYTRAVIIEACQHGQSVVFDWMKRDIRPADRLWHDAAMYAVGSGQASALEWLMRDDFIARHSGLLDQPQRLWVVACRGDHLGVLQWLLSHSIVVTDAKQRKHLMRVSMGRGHGRVIGLLKNIFHEVLAADALLSSEVVAFEREWGCQ